MKTMKYTRNALPLVLFRLLPLLLILAAARPALLVADDKAANADAVAAPESVADLLAIEAKVKKAITRAIPCTVGVQVGAGRGSGVIVSEDGLVMTAGHVVGEPGKDVTFYFHDGKTAKGKTLGMFKTYDVGLMKIEDKGKWPVAEKGDSKEVSEAIGASRRAIRLAIRKIDRQSYGSVGSSVTTRRSSKPTVPWSVATRAARSSTWKAASSRSTVGSVPRCN